MGKNDGDAYPDPRKGRSGRCRTRTLVCIGLLLICFCGFITAVCAPDWLPDPRSVPRPIFNDHPNDKPTENSVVRTQSILMVE